ncbi:MAG: 7-cyano-7-deazaguanine synthase QueC [Candidatus Omnitrophica bacterium]|nr:7-cyano-7-deazaguanine synthase QueC [Candidatus Omnitrophota bacterium]MBD3268612.1 7-cyano-7-deazaguanine synthase QueC [Candidatus Omnitrophota bacterium]
MRKRNKIKESGKKAVVLLSGGIDSVTVLYYALSKGYESTALIFDYGQRHRKELLAAKKIARKRKIKHYVVKTSFPWANSSLTNKDISVPCSRNLKRGIPLTYVAGRNIVFLSYAFSLAESIGAKSVFIGAHTQDYSGYPDCRPEFLGSFEKAACRGMKEKGIKLKAPLVRKSKKDIIKIGLELGVPFTDTWSCYEGRMSPCRKCDSCRFRIQAFRSLGLIDPLLKNISN